MTSLLNLSPCDPVWEATRPDRGPVTHDVVFDVERWGAGWSKVEQDNVPCYSADEAARVARRLTGNGRKNVRVVARGGVAS